MRDGTPRFLGDLGWLIDEYIRKGMWYDSEMSRPTIFEYLWEVLEPLNLRKASRKRFLLENAPTWVLWKESIGRYPEGGSYLDSFRDPRTILGFPARDYMRACRQLAQDGRDIKSREVLCQAAVLAVTFGPAWRDWLKGATGAEVHDLVYWLPGDGILPEDGLGQWLLRQRRQIPGLIPARVSDLAVVAKAWPRLTLDERKLGLSAILTIAKSRKYAKVRHVGLATECAAAGVDERIYSTLESRWLRAQEDLCEDWIPRVEVQVGDYTAYTMRRDDPRGLWLGQHTGCCQHPGGAGETCSWHGVQSPRGGFVAVECEGRILAQSWVWRSPERPEVLVCDNIESMSGSHRAYLPSVYDALAQAFLGRLGIEEVWVGEGYSDCDLAQWKLAEKPIPAPPGVYSDAYHQRVIAMAPAIEPVEPVEPVVVTAPTVPHRWALALSEIDAEAILDIESAAYPEELRTLAGLGSVEDLASYCEAPVEQVLVIGDLVNWYGLVSVHGERAEFVDLAKRPGSARLDPVALVRAVGEITGAVTITADARAATSLRRLRDVATDLAACGWIVAEGAVEDRDGHEFREVELRRVAA